MGLSYRRPLHHRGRDRPACRPRRSATRARGDRGGARRHLPQPDGGAHWCDLAVPLLRPRGTYCRALAFAPGEPATLYLGAGNDFDGDAGALFITRDDGRNWASADLGMPLRCTIFALAVDPRRPDDIYCASKYGHVFLSRDRGSTWQRNPLPPGAGHVYALAAG